LPVLAHFGNENIAQRQPKGTGSAAPLIFYVGMPLSAQVCMAMPEKESAKLLRYEGGNVMGTMPESADAFGLSEDPANNRCPGLLLNGATAQP